MKRIILILLTGLLISIQQVNAQKTGEKFSPSQLQGIEKTITPEEKAVLPLSASLKSFCPTVADQHGGTCFAYSSAYAGRTILYNATLNNTSVNDNTTFSPGYIVRLLQRKRLGNANCRKGASTIEACKRMQTAGVVPLKFYPQECSSAEISAGMKVEALKYKINIKSLFDSSDPNEDKIYQIKQALVSGHPVVIGLTTMRSFNEPNTAANPDLWIPTEAEKARANNNNASHAICIVGYKTTEDRSVFEIMNSWGDDWKNGGFTFVKCEDLIVFLAFGIELSN